MHKIFLLVLSLTICSCVAEPLQGDLTGLVPQASIRPPAPQNWNFTAYAINAANVDEVFFADITKAEVLKDGKTYVPAIVVNTKNNKAGELEWARFDCSSRYTEKLKFVDTRPTSILEAKEGSVSWNLMTMMCGMQNDLYGIMFNTGNYWYIGYKNSEIKNNTENPTILDFRMYEYALDGRIGASSIARLDCNTKVMSGIFTNNPNTYSEVYIDKQQYKHFADKVCLLHQVTSTAVVNSGPLSSSDGFVNNLKSPSKTSIDDAKRKCEQLGFRPKTEKFGKCVLELTK